jgi:hypothetical protein
MADEQVGRLHCTSRMKETPQIGQDRKEAHAAEILPIPSSHAIQCGLLAELAMTRTILLSMVILLD